MIAVEQVFGRALEIAHYMPAMLIQAASQPDQEFIRNLWRIQEKHEPPQPIDDADSNVHSTSPVDATGPGVLGYPIFNLLDELRGVSLLSRDPIGLS